MPARSQDRVGDASLGGFAQTTVQPTGRGPFAPEPVREYRRRTYLRLVVLGTWIAAALWVLRQVWVHHGAGGPPAWLLLGLIGVVATGIPLVVWAWRTRPRNTRIVFRLPGILRRDRQAASLYGEERFAEAATLWEQVCREASPTPLTHALAVYNLGLCRLVLGDPEQALDLVDAALSSGWHQTWALRRRQHLLLGGRAFTLAVLGRLDEAHSQQDVAHARCPDAQHGWLVATDALLAARSKNHGALLEAYPRWAELAAQAGGAPQQRTLAVLRAFALEATGENHDAVAAALAKAPDLHRGNVDYLAARWPELAAFLARHQLDAEAAGGAPAPLLDGARSAPG